MHRLSVDSISPLLPMLQQPAFCIRSNGTIVCNAQAEALAPRYSAALPAWLGSCKVLYDAWDRTGSLQFSLTLHAVPYTATLRALQDGTLFLLAPCAPEGSAEILGVVSQTMRKPLCDLSSLLYLMETEPQKDHLPAVRHHLHQMSRIAANLTELTRLSHEAPLLHCTDTDTEQFLLPFLEEVEDLCRSTGRPMSHKLPKKAVGFRADEVLLKRALLNLISNALKYGTPGTPITLRTETIGTHLVFQIENECSGGEDELLRAAFSRLSQREPLPDPSWGIGLGLPLANTIARLHGGMVAVETNRGKATVSLSVSLCPQRELSELSCLAADYTGGMRQALLELSDALPTAAYER